MRDTAHAGLAASPDLKRLVWHWDPARRDIVWAGPALLTMLGLAELDAVRRDPVWPSLIAASHDTAETGRAAITVQRPEGLLHGVTNGRRLVLPDGRLGLAVEWAVAGPTSTRPESALAAGAFAASPLPMAVLDAMGATVAVNRAYAALVPSAGYAALPEAWEAREQPLEGGLRLLSLIETRPADGAVVESGALARIAHEFRSPLTAVLGFAEFLSATAGELPPERLRAYLADLTTAAERMRILADDLVAMGDGSTALRIAETALDDILSEALTLTRPLAARERVTLEPPAPTGLIALVDGHALGRAVTNLLDNAIRHGGGTVRLHLADDGREAGATITVADTGPGLSEAALQTALQPYGRAETAQDPARAGGLGLPIVRDIIEAHGGRFTVETAPGTGFTARLHLPPGRVFRLKARR